MSMTIRFKSCLARNSGAGPCTKGPKIYGRFCAKHKGQYESGLIDRNGKKLRDPTPRSLRRWRNYKKPDCVAKNAGTGECSQTRAGRFCSKHRSQYDKRIIDWKGKKLRDLKPKNWRKGKPGKKIFQGCVARRPDSPCGRYINGRFCQRHRAAYYRGEIDTQGNRLRNPKKGSHSQCVAKGKGEGECSNRRGRCRFCGKHQNQYHKGIIDYNGNVIRKLIKPVPPRKPGSGSPFCVGRNAGTGKCSRYKPGERFCRRHHAQYYVGHIIDYDGNKLRDPQTVEKCGIPECGSHAGYLSGLCQYHYIDIIVRGHYNKYPSLMPTLDSTMPIEDIKWNNRRKDV